MSTTRVNLSDGSSEQTLLIRGAKVADVVRELTEQSAEVDVVESFLNYVGASVSVETPDSSNVQRIVYNFPLNEVSFVFDNDSESSYPSTFEKFLEDIKAPSAGKQQWKYRRGER